MLNYKVIAIALLLLLSACAKKEVTDTSMYYKTINKQVDNQRQVARDLSSAIKAVADQSKVVDEDIIADREKTLRTQAMAMAIIKASSAIKVNIAAPAGFVFKDDFFDSISSLPGTSSATEYKVGGLRDGNDN